MPKRSASHPDLETLAPSAGPQLVRGGTASIMCLPCLPSTWFPSRNLDHRWTEHCVFLQGELVMPRTSTIVAPEHDTVADEAASAYRVVDFSGGPTGFNGNRIQWQSDFVGTDRLSLHLTRTEFIKKNDTANQISKNNA
jgi:hypothetical protein